MPTRRRATNRRIRIRLPRPERHDNVNSANEDEENLEPISEPSSGQALVAERAELRRRYEEALHPAEAFFRGLDGVRLVYSCPDGTSDVLITNANSRLRADGVTWIEVATAASHPAERSPPPSPMDASDEGEPEAEEAAPSPGLNRPRGTPNPTAKSRPREPIQYILRLKTWPWSMGLPALLFLVGQSLKNTTSTLRGRSTLPCAHLS